MPAAKVRADCTVEGVDGFGVRSWVMQQKHCLPPTPRCHHMVDLLLEVGWCTWDLQEPMAQFPAQQIQHVNASQSSHQCAGGHCARLNPGCLHAVQDEASRAPVLQERQKCPPTNPNEPNPTETTAKSHGDFALLNETRQKGPHDRVLHGLENVIVCKQIVLAMGVEPVPYSKSPVISAALYNTDFSEDLLANR